MKGGNLWWFGISEAINGWIIAGFQQETMDSGIKLIGDKMGKARRERSI